MIEFLSPKDLEQIASEDISLSEINSQMEMFRRGMNKVRLNRPCRIGDGIETIDAREAEGLIIHYEQAALQGRFLKFVPASGAASRMFDRWQRILSHDRREGNSKQPDIAIPFERFPFYRDLAEPAFGSGLDLDTLLSHRRFPELIKLVISPNGLDYGRKPKALIKFHSYPEGDRTALEEHLVEAALYVKDRDSNCRIHFTIGEEHRGEIEAFINEIKGIYEQKWQVRFQIGISLQARSTGTIAADGKGGPLRDENGRLVFRPGGHGAILGNLERTGGDLVFIKNIDNVAPDRMKGETVFWKKVLAGYLVRLQKEIFGLLELLSLREAGAADLEAAAWVCQRVFHHEAPGNFDSLSEEGKLVDLYRRLNRPLRVCGVVKNAGEPGGGPFFVDLEGGGSSKQIIEEFQIDKGDKNQMKSWREATHFNPVDLVCGLRNWRGEAFVLSRFVDERSYGISEKSKDGISLLALERPGLWNGGMGFWNTVFVEVPLGTFNPVKTVEDLLREEHRQDHAGLQGQ